jgi:hypothetical protein
MRPTFVFLLLASAAARSQDFYVAADPLPYALHGFSAHGGVVLPGDRFSVEVALFSSRLGDTLLKLVEPEDGGFTADLKGLSFEGYWHAITWSRNALLLGLQVHLDRFSVHHDSSPAESTFDQVYLFPTVAYRWFPFEGVGFFLKPFVSAGLPLLSRGDVTVGARSFKQLSVFPLATAVIGFQF